MSPWIFLRYLLLPAIVVAGNYFGGWWNFIVPVICFVIHPLFSLVGRSKKADQHDEHDDYPSVAYRIVALLFVPVLLAVTVWAIYQIQRGSFSAIEFCGLVLSTGIMNGVIGFTLAHEFIHRFNKTDRAAGLLLLLQNNYLHYSIEHIGGHHVYACTSKDPHTARLNESFYQFLPRAMKYTFINAWEIECRRLFKKNHSIRGLHNRMIVFCVLQLSLSIIIIVFAGWLAFLFLLFQGMVAIGLLHATNYLQHYGLMRKEEQPGYYEKVNTHHAWNSPHPKDGLSLFRVENHADHHMHPSRTYEQLSPHEDSPEQPAGYSGMILLALMPPLWFRIMNKRIPSFINKTA
jgi:alkane 1-monooxygenase